MRVPTYASYVNLLNASLKNKEQLDLYSFQATTICLILKSRP